MELTVLGRLVLAIVFAGVIGWDRERKGRPAGLRTHMLVGLASALLVGLGEIYVARHPSGNIDPLRVLEAVVTGVSFLGAGTVFVSKGRGGSVQGLTTAASIWAVSAVGVAVGLGEYIIATGTTLFALIILVAATGFEQRHPQKTPEDSDGEEEP